MARGGKFQKKIETVHWTLGTVSMNSQGAGSQAVNVLSAQHLPETLMRIRGQYDVFKNAVGVPGEHVSVTVGLIAVPEGTGSTVLWSPQTDGDAPWIWWYSTVIAYEEMVIDVVDVPGITSARATIDNKAMRRLRNQEIQFVAENITLGSVMSVNHTLSARFLSGS